MSTIGEIATRIYDNEFDDAPTQLEREFRIEYISGWLEANVGQLNTLTYQNFSISGDFLQEEEAIMSKMYLKDYYNKSSRSILITASTGNMPWTRLTEGDTTIVRSSNLDYSREYKNLSKSASEDLKELVYAYNSYQAMPRQTAGNDACLNVSGSGCYA